VACRLDASAAAGSDRDPGAREAGDARDCCSLSEVSWLFLIGLALDGVGALLIAWPILVAGSAAREAGRPRWGGDHWASFRGDRERRLVQYGALALAAGFALQAFGLVIRMGGLWWVALIVLAAVLSFGVAVGTALARRRLPKHVWHPVLPPKDQIGTGLHTYGVSTTVDLEKVVARSLWETKQVIVESIDERPSAVVSSGGWIVFCPRCHQPTTATTPEWGNAIRTACGARYGVGYPDEGQRDQIEAELLRQPDPEKRRWSGE
jgi:hypothetical protein